MAHEVESRLFGEREEAREEELDPAAEDGVLSRRESAEEVVAHAQEEDLPGAVEVGLCPGGDLYGK